MVFLHNKGGSGMQPSAWRRSTIHGAAALFMFYAVVSQAQQPAATGPAEQATTGGGTGSAATLEEVVVTAQKRTESAQEIPKTVEVLNQSALTRAGVTNLQDLNLISPSIQGAATAGSPPAIRGVSSFAFSIGVQAQTGVVLDDVPQPNFSTLADELSDVERVEVLPGPQSTLSGRNAAGGLINIVTRNPTSSFAANITGEATDDHQRRVAGYVTGPLSEQFGFSLSGFLNDWDGPLHNVATGDRLGGYDRSGVRGKLQFQPTDQFTATITAYYTHNKAPNSALAAGYSYVQLSDNAASFFAPQAPLKSILQVNAGPYNRDLNSATEGELRSHDQGATLRLSYDASAGTLVSITNISESKTQTSTPLTAFAFFPDTPVQQDYDVKYKTQEFRLASPRGDSKLQYLAGLIYSDTRIFEPYARQLIAPVDWDRTATIRSVALYGNATYALLPRTFLIPGLRLQHDYQSYDWVFLDGIAPHSSGSNTYNFASGDLSLRHEFNRDFSLYITYANAQTGRAYDLEDQVSAASPAGLSPLNSERAHNFEGGFKSQWLEHRLTLNASLFDVRYRNYQIQSAFLPNPASLPSIRLLAIGRVESRGAQLDSAFAATPDLLFNAAATFLDAKIRDYPNAICYTGQILPSCAGALGNQGNLAGTSMPGASRFKGVVSAAYTLRLPLPIDAIFNAFYRYQSATHFDILNDPASHVGGFGILNLAAGIQDHNRRYTLQFFVNNVLDKKNYASLARDTIVFDPTGANPAAVYATYARDWQRYAGLRLNFAY
jgi:iron complex outermembrane receptor protein